MPVASLIYFDRFFPGLKNVRCRGLHTYLQRMGGQASYLRIEHHLLAELASR